MLYALQYLNNTYHFKNSQNTVNLKEGYILHFTAQPMGCKKRIVFERVMKWSP